MQVYRAERRLSDWDGMSMVRGEAPTRQQPCFYSFVPFTCFLVSPSASLFVDSVVHTSSRRQNNAFEIRTHCCNCKLTANPGTACILPTILDMYSRGETGRLQPRVEPFSFTVCSLGTFCVLPFQLDTSRRYRSIIRHTDNCTARGSS